MTSQFIRYLLSTMVANNYIVYSSMNMKITRLFLHSLWTRIDPSQIGVTCQFQALLFLGIRAKSCIRSPRLSPSLTGGLAFVPLNSLSDGPDCIGGHYCKQNSLMDSVKKRQNPVRPLCHLVSCCGAALVLISRCNVFQRTPFN